MTTGPDEQLQDWIGTIELSGLFKAEEYVFRSEAARLGEHPIRHYLTSGEARGGRPSRLFNPTYYRLKYGVSGGSPLINYILRGRVKNHRTVPVSAEFEMKVRSWRAGRQRVLVIMPDHSDHAGLVQAVRLIDGLVESTDVIAVFLDHPQPAGVIDPGIAGIVRPLRKIPPGWTEIPIESQFFTLRIVRKFGPHAIICFGKSDRGLTKGFTHAFIPTIAFAFDDPVPGDRDRQRQHRYSAAVLFPSGALKDEYLKCNPYLPNRRLEVVPHFSGKSAGGGATVEAILPIIAGARDLMSRISARFADICQLEGQLKRQPSLLFKPEHFVARLRENCIIGGLRTGRGPALPVPRLLTGFDMARFIAEHRPDGVNAVLDYILENCPARFRRQVIGPASSRDPGKQRVALHAHLYHTDVAGEFLSALAINRHPIDLFLSTDTLSKAEELSAIVGEHAMRAEIRVLPNKGRDLGPLLTGFRDILAGQYDIIGHIHSKKSQHGAAGFGDSWRRYLVENTLGGAYPVADMVISAFDQDGGLGLVFPEHDEVRGWDCNMEPARDLLQRLNSDPVPETRYFDFPAGCFFWCRPSALRPLLSLDLGWEDYPPEPVPVDGTVLHALERLLGIICLQTGHRVATTCVVQEGQRTVSRPAAKLAGHPA